jgi:hypothetical protein
MESLMMTDYLSTEMSRTLKEYVTISLQFAYQYLTSLRFEEYYELAFNRVDAINNTSNRQML